MCVMGAGGSTLVRPLHVTVENQLTECVSINSLCAWNMVTVKRSQEVLNGEIAHDVEQSLNAI